MNWVYSWKAENELVIFLRFVTTAQAFTNQLSSVGNTRIVNRLLCQFLNKSDQLRGNHDVFRNGGVLFRQKWLNLDFQVRFSLSKIFYLALDFFQDLILD